MSHIQSLFSSVNQFFFSYFTLGKMCEIPFKAFISTFAILFLLPPASSGTPRSPVDFDLMENVNPKEWTVKGDYSYVQWGYQLTEFQTKFPTTDFVNHSGAVKGAEGVWAIFPNVDPTTEDPHSTHYTNMVKFTVHFDGSLVDMVTIRQNSYSNQNQSSTPHAIINVTSPSSPTYTHALGNVVRGDWTDLSVKVGGGQNVSRNVLDEALTF